MQKKGIVIVGLGPAGANYLTREAWEHLLETEEIYLRTAFHPVCAELPEHLARYSFDHLYESQQILEDVLKAIVSELVGLARRPQGVTYGVPGSPFIGEETVSQVVEILSGTDIPVRVIDGLGYLEPVCTALGLDLLPQTAILDGLYVGSLLVPPFPPSTPAIISQLGGQFEASELKLTLMHNYPDEFEVKLLHNLGTPEEIIETLPLYAIDQSVHLGMMSLLYLPAREEGTAFEDLQEVIARLRAPGGCPWDREQTHLSLRQHLLEEAYETLEALDDEDMEGLREELGDLLLQIVLHAQIATEEGDFNMTDVLSGINNKLKRRHPHVFAGLVVDSVDTVLHNWEKIKASERKDHQERPQGLLDSIPEIAPALSQSEQIQRKAARVGFDWQTIEPVIDKIHEELAELKAAESPEEREKEGGDVLFAMVNLLRWLEVDPETALRGTNTRFKNRFAYIEESAREQGKSLNELGFEEMDALWEEAKHKLSDMID
ncbi:MAG: nucleoside triphosphate pyrophosphohydrolase [Chloroflexi bacterium]|nr:nucleoside triphosphate pyrophosphohydrolase [Chloroflexota bacterium]